ncbi:hypothetical protein HD806DRAFT_475373 [Xylariaceae sp. AK1471]|nr:hypothetical protein HD806DRAFT_475373 [Xylariaceae sp. AK1471]
MPGVGLMRVMLILAVTQLRDWDRYLALRSNYYNHEFCLVLQASLVGKIEKIMPGHARERRECGCRTSPHPGTGVRGKQTTLSLSVQSINRTIDRLID